MTSLPRVPTRLTEVELRATASKLWGELDACQRGEIDHQELHRRRQAIWASVPESSKRDLSCLLTAQRTQREGRP